MRVAEFLSSTWSFLKLHRIVILMICAIIAGSIFSIYMLLRGHVMTPTFADVPRRPTRVSIPPVLPHKPLAAWGEDPFKDVVKEMEIAKKKAAAAVAAKAAEDARKKAAAAAAAKAAEEAAEKARQEAIEKAQVEQKEREKREKERAHRKKVIQSIRVEGIGSGVRPRESFAIIQGKPYNISNTVVKNGVKAVIVAIEQNAVIFKDPVSGDKYRVPLSR